MNKNELLEKSKDDLNRAIKKSNIEMVDLSVYCDNKLEFPKENEVVRFIDKNNNIDFEAKITKVKEGKTSIDKIIEFEKIENELKFVPDSNVSSTNTTIPVRRKYKCL